MASDGPVVDEERGPSGRRSHAGTASGLLNTCRQLGGVLAVEVFGAPLVAGRAGFLHGLRVSLLMAVAPLPTTALAGPRLRPTTRK